MELKGKVIVVTGGAGLLGRVFCEAICVAGGSVVVADKSDAAGKELVLDLASRFEGRAIFCSLDVTSDSSVEVLIETTHAKFGKIDALVNNAYPRNKIYGKVFEDVAYHDFVENVGMHVGGYFSCSKHFANYFMNQNAGNIVNLASVYGVVPPRFEIYDGTPMTMPVEYAVLKAGVIHLTKYMSRYFKGKNIRCNSISPGGIENNQPDSFIQQYNSFGNTKGLLKEQDICGTLLFLLSDASTFVNGQNILVDDGWSL